MQDGLSALTAELIAAGVLALIRQFGARGSAIESPFFYWFGTVGLAVVCAAALWSDGPLGGAIVAAVAWIAAPLAADGLLYRPMRHGTRTTFADFRGRRPWARRAPSPATLDLNKLRAQWKREEQERLRIASRPAIAQVLAEQRRAPQDIERIEDVIMKAGLGARIARKVVSDPKLLREYYTLEARGIQSQQLARLYLRQFGDP